MSDKPFNNVISIKTLKREFGKEKHCTCYEFGHFPPNPVRYELDMKNREVICVCCGESVDPFDALSTISEKWEKINYDVECAQKLKKELYNYKPWLLMIRDLERNCRSGTMVLSCPHCHSGILFEEMTAWVNKERELQRRKFKRKDGASDGR